MGTAASCFLLQAGPVDVGLMCCGVCHQLFVSTQPLTCFFSVLKGVLGFGNVYF